jgi:uracil-DNA glycosylase family 4
LDKADELDKLYKEIFRCRNCHPKVFASEVQRQVLRNTLNSQIVLMAQAPGKTGVRISGVHWNKKNGTLTKGGSFLDKQLALINYSVNLTNKGIQRPYTTNVLQCWTGRIGDGSRDRPPITTELENCNQWWQKEIEIIHPRVMVLLGKPATECFAQGIGKKWIFAEMLKRQGDPLTIGDVELEIFFLPHPTAPYKELIDPYRTKSEIYQEVFQQVKGRLNS